MEVCITNQCKQRILENDLNFQVKGYVFLKDTDNLIKQTEDVKTLTLNDFISSKCTIVYNKDHKYFDTAYIPNLEVQNENSYNFGSYSIKIDKGLDKENPNGLSDKFDAILVIGEDIKINKEDELSISELNKQFLAAIITDTDGIDTNNQQTITIHLAIGENPVGDSPELSPKYTSLPIEMKDTYTTKVNDYLFLTPNNGYENSIKQFISNICGESIDGKFINSNISIADETDKISNIWNIGNSAGTVTIFSKDGYNSNITKPQLMLTCSAEKDFATYYVNSINFKYSSKENTFSIGQDTGNENLQIDILPEYYECLSISDYHFVKMGDGFMQNNYENIEDTPKYFRLASISSTYSNSNDICEIRSKKSFLTDCSGVSFYGNLTFNNYLANVTDSVFIDTQGSNDYTLNWFNDILSLNSKYINSIIERFTPNKPNNISFIGSEYITTKVNGLIDNVTYIGRNKNSRNEYPYKYSNISDNPRIVNLNEYYLSGLSSTYPLTATEDTDINIGNFAAIGFENLALNRTYPLDYNNSIYSVIFGHDNSYTSPFIMRKDGDGRIYFNNKNDMYFNNTYHKDAYKQITADEGDYSLYKIVTVGNGKDNSGTDPFSPAEYASKYYTGEKCYTLDLFSVEKESFQLVHSGYNSWASINYIPKLFAIRGRVPVFNKYSHKNLIDSVTFEENVNKYNLQNAFYTPDTLYVPMPRTSNDVYKIGLKDIYQALNNNSFTQIPVLPDTSVVTTETNDVYDEWHNRVVITNNNSISGISGNIPLIKDCYIKIFNITDETEKNKIFNDGKIYTVYFVNDSECKKRLIIDGAFII